MRLNQRQDFFPRFNMSLSSWRINLFIFHDIMPFIKCRYYLCISGELRGEWNQSVVRFSLYMSSRSVCGFQRKCVQFVDIHDERLRDEWYKAGTLAGWILSFAAGFTCLSTFFGTTYSPSFTARRRKSGSKWQLLSQQAKPTDPPRHAIHRFRREHYI